MARDKSKPRYWRETPELGERVRALLIYEPDTGLLRWRNASNRGRGHAAGSVAGSVSKDGYVRVHIGLDCHLGHRLIWVIQTGTWPVDEIDHNNGRRSENWWDNLREATRGQNAINQQLRSDSTTGLVGVTRQRCQLHPWRARIHIDRKEIYIGAFPTQESAYAAYLAKRAELHPFQPAPRST